MPDQACLCTRSQNYFQLGFFFCQTLKKLAQLPKQLSGERNADISPSKNLSDSFFFPTISACLCIVFRKEKQEIKSVRRVVQVSGK